MLPQCTDAAPHARGSPIPRGPQPSPITGPRLMRCGRAGELTCGNARMQILGHGRDRPSRRSPFASSWASTAPGWTTRASFACPLSLA